MEAGVWVWADHNSYMWDRMVYQSSSSSDEEEASLTLVGTLFLWDNCHSKYKNSLISKF